MDVPFPFHSSVLILCFVLLLPSAKPVSDGSTLLYKSCASQKLAQTQTQTLSSLFQQLIAQSSESKFFKTTEMGSDDTAISGLFQCREDISREECFNCVNLLTEMSSTLCSQSAAARVQLERCYTQYEIDGFSDDDIGDYKRSLLNSECGEPTLDYVNAKFRELMDAAFVSVQTEILDSKVDFYARNYESVMLMAQCEADLDACVCSECVSDAIQVAREECGTSLSAHIYLDKCFMTYMYHPDATPGNSFPGVNRNNSNNKRTAAIIVGGAAALCFGFIFLLFLISRSRNKEYH
ncbi:hypothetical protein L6164_035186 [Bauhinia variegata]|uniref:Uncharacterized protein n=1 Tax=Bauhinia variegata TaxID=167791 RepID=A0ACB9KY43_BAUVA|nr:hypothetical protein L6164_035186 [Bauhinia variegata]